MGVFAGHGKANTPVAIIQNGTLPEERTVVGQVHDIQQKAADSQIDNPAIIVIGEVAALGNSDWKAEFNALVADSDTI
jgi:uroporphyrin-III C-methyltransferase